MQVRCDETVEVTCSVREMFVTGDETFLSSKHQSCMSQALKIETVRRAFPREEAARRHNEAMLHAVHRSEARAFPLSSSMPELPPKIPDQIIDFYAFVFLPGRLVVPSQVPAQRFYRLVTPARAPQIIRSRRTMLARPYKVRQPIRKCTAGPLILV